MSSHEASHPTFEIPHETDGSGVADRGEARTERMMGKKFMEYLDPRMSLEARLERAFEELHIGAAECADLMREVESLREHHEDTARHSIRVALLMRLMAAYTGLDETELLKEGLLHDTGKKDISPDVLSKTENWTAEDQHAMIAHVHTGHDRLADTYPLAAYVALLHHRFQRNPYPTKLPAVFENKDETTKANILRHARIAAMADTYDALHRVNSRNGNPQLMTGEAIKKIMLDTNPDERELIEKLYEEGIFTVAVLEDSKTGSLADL